MHKKRSLVIVAVAMFLAGVAFAAKFGWIDNVKAKEYFAESKGAALIPNAYPSFSGLVKKTSPSVVNVYTTKKAKVGSNNPFGGRGMPRDQFDDFFERFFEGMPRQQQRDQNSLGSGFVISPEGNILTNNHVVAEADEINVQFSDGKKYSAKVVGTDERTDIAIIKVQSDKDLPFVPLGDSDALEIGDWVVAVGNPFGLDHSVTAGIVSAKGRVIGAGPYDNFIQTDASINPGNSGGPLFNLAGEVVGINTAIFSAGQGLGFAIPINMAKKLIPQLVEKGKIVDRGWLGVTIQQMTDELARSFGMNEQRGALVGDVVPSSPAERAGIKRGDIILKFAGTEIKKSNELPGLVANTASGKEVDVELLRNGKKQTVKVLLGTQQEQEEELAAAAKKQGGGKPDALGLIVRALSTEDAYHLNIPQGKGVVIARVESGSAADMTDVRVGDIILELNGKEINSVADYTKASAPLKKGDIVRLFIKRDRGTVYIAFKI